MALHSIYLIFATSVFCIFSCNRGVVPAPDPVQQYAAERFGNDYLQNYNETKEFVVLSKLYKIKPSDPFPTLRFEVLEVKSMEVIFNDNLRGGKVSWIRDYILEAEALKSIPGPDGQGSKDNTYRYHVQNRKKFTGGFFN